jgi:ectoine hydroxylase-related dioxygenase (phytanoyl-CoA dioxygenase family)
MTAFVALKTERALRQVAAFNAAPLKELSDHQHEFYERFGYLAIERITSGEDVSLIRGEIETLFRRHAGYEEGVFFDFSGAEDCADAFNIPQLCGPHRFAPKLVETEFFRNAQSVAWQILGPHARMTQDHVILKPGRPQNQAGGGTVECIATPWHQDEAFGDPALDYHEVSFWLALQDVNEINGCMKFVPGSHREGVVHHAHPGGDPRVHAVDCVASFDHARIVSCPIPAGGCTLHSTTTIHGAGPNLSNEPRWAYVLVFGIPPTPAKQPRNYPWLVGRTTAAMRRRRMWMLRGGALLHVWRKVSEQLRRS